MAAERGLSAGRGGPWRQAATQLRVVRALILREVLTRYGRHNIGFLWLFVEPMMFTLGITALWSLTKQNHGSSLPIVSFALTGYSSVLVWRNAANRCTKAIEANLALMYHADVRPLDIFLARIFLEVVGVTVSFALLTLMFVSIEWIEPPRDIVMVAQGWGLLVVFGVSIGLIVGALSELSEVAERVWHTVTYLTFPLSGAVFMLEWLPRGIRTFVEFFPMVHGTESVRHGFYGDAVKSHEDLAYLATVDAFLLMVGLALVVRVTSRVEPE
jgi:capsular polysaccharide transport system permease protein